MEKAIWTLGYEGADVAAFVATLQAAGIQRVVDVRERPLSRKKGFSKNVLAEHLDAADIAYENRKRLGAPPEIRNPYKAGGSWETFAAAFEARLDGAPEALAGLARTAQEERVCLVCFEADAGACHRSLVAARLAPLGFKVHDLRCNL
ncbi:MAG: DUF488 family protein [Thermoplasmatota archaeon]